MKPWGPLPWLLGKLPTERLVVLGCLGAEDRSIAVPRALRKEGGAVNGVLRVDDGPSRYADRVEFKIAKNRERLRRAGIRDERVVDLMADDDAIAEGYRSFVDGQGKSVSLVLDISCIPKRFFFLMLRLAVQDRRVHTLFVSYTQPEDGRYTYEPLADEPEEVAPIPGYSPTGVDPEMLIVGLGFERHGLANLIAEYRAKQRDIEVLLPFPPGQPYSRRIWQAFHKLELGRGERRAHRVNALDAFGSYAKITDLGELARPSAPPALAPYGPKPMSLGMCLYALRNEAPVYYTQPRVYHPDYTVGIGKSWGYCLRYQKRAFF